MSDGYSFILILIIWYFLNGIKSNLEKIAENQKSKEE